MERFKASNKAIRVLFISLALAAIYVLFHERWETLISDTIVKHLFSFCKSTYLNDVIIICSVILVIFWGLLQIKRKRIVEYPTAVLAILMFLFYVFYRLQAAPWKFTTFKLSPSFAYLDVFIVLSLLYIVLAIITIFRKTPFDYHAGFTEDHPIGEEYDDLLGYIHYARGLAEKLKESIFEHSFAIGVTGDWGTGKTSFMNLVVDELRYGNKIIFTFNAWSSQTGNGLTANFFGTFEEQLRPYHSDLSPLLEQYTESLIKETDRGLSKLLQPFRKETSLETQQKEIDRILKRIGRQVVVVIDDLDRLYEDELHEVIKLIRNTANFHNTVFIVGYDRNYLVNALKKISGHRPEVFLEKIFSLEITLPHFDRDVLQSQLLFLLKERLDPNWNTHVDQILNDSYLNKDSIFEQYITTLRDVTRFSNAFVLNLELVKDDVVPHEFFFLELLHFKYPSVYEVMHRQFGDFFESIEENLTRKALSLKVENQTVKIKAYLTDQAETLSLPKNEVDRAFAIVHKLFPTRYVSEYNRRTLSIRYPHNFYKYFAIRLLPGHISEREFTKARSEGFDTLLKFIRDCLNKNLHQEITRKFTDITEYKDRQDFETVIRAIFFLANQRLQEGQAYGQPIGYPGRDLYDKLYVANKGGLKKLYDGDRNALNKFILGILYDAKYPYEFESAIVHDLVDRNFQDNFPVSLETFEKLMAHYVEKALARSRVFTRYFWYLYGNCWFKRFTLDSNRIIHHPYLIPECRLILVDHLRQIANPTDFLHTTIDFDIWSDKKAGIIPDVLGLFETGKAFIDFITIFFNVRKEPSLQEYLNFARRVEEVNFEGMVDVDFKYFPKIGKSIE